MAVSMVMINLAIQTKVRNNKANYIEIVEVNESEEQHYCGGE